MNRTLIAFFPPTALAAGLFLAHCSSSTPVVVSGDSGTDQHSGGTGTGTGTGKGTGSGSGTGTSAGSSTGSGTGTSAGSSTGSGTGSGPSLLDGSTGDNDAACTPPAGGAFCTPGHVTCGGVDGGCAVPATVCCETSSGNSCTAPSACSASTSVVIGCNERADCPSHQICCLNASSASPPEATTSCVDPVAPADGGTDFQCPEGIMLGWAQICRSSAECPPGVACSFWMCDGNQVESCGVPNGLLGSTCMPLNLGSGSGSSTGSGSGS